MGDRAKRRVVVVNGFQRTGSARCFHAVRLILASRGVEHAIAQADMALLDDIIDRHRSTTQGADWLVAKSHRWMPSSRDPDIVALFTERSPRDVALSLLKARLRLAGPPADRLARAEIVARSEALWQAFFRRHAAEALPIERLRYEDYFGREAALVTDIARHIGVDLDPEAIEAIAAEITPAAAQARSDAMSVDYDPELNFYRGHLSDTRGRPGAGVPDVASEEFRSFLADLERLDRPRPPLPSRRAARATGAVPLSDRPLRFMHMRKTGGTTLDRILADFFAPADRHLCHLGMQADLSADVAAALAGARYLRGHGDFLDLGRPDAFRVTVLREPMDRLRSERRQWTQAGEENLAVMPQAAAAATRDLQGRDLKGILARIRDLPDILPSFWNHQTLMLGLAPVRRRAGANFPAPTTGSGDRAATGSDGLPAWLHAHADDLLEAAVRRLDGLDQIGLFENFEASVAELLDRLGLPQPVLPLPRLNRREAYADETDPGVAALAADFVRLDRLLYAEVLSRRRAAETPPVPRAIPPVTYVDRRLGPDAAVRIAADDAPNGHGWHHPHIRADGRPARWTTGYAEWGLAAAAGRYRFRLTFFGGASAESLAQVVVTADGTPIDLTATPQQDGGPWILAGDFTKAATGWLTLALAAPAPGGHGLEVAGLTLEPVPEETGLPAVSPLPIDLSAVFAADDLPYFGSRQAAEAQVYGWYAGYGAVFRPRSILEIGVRRGYGAYALVVGAGGSVARYVGIDMELDIPGSNQAAEALLRGLGIAEVTLIRADTRACFPALAGAFDLIHVDGDHSTAGALGDIVHALPLLAPGGILIVDDVETAPVRAAVDMVRAALAGRAAIGEAGDRHRQALIRPGPDAPRLVSVAAVLAAAPPQALGRYRFDLAMGALRRLDPARRDEALVARLAADLVAAGRLRLGAAPAEAVPGTVRPADAMVAGFVDFFAALSAAAGSAGAPRPWEAEFREHGGYALARLDGLAVPDALAGTERLAQAFRSPSPAFGLMLHEFACNLAAIAERALDLVEAGRV